MKIISFVCIVLALVSVARADIADLQKQFAQPPDDCKIMVRWWWFGPAVTQPQLLKEMELMKQGGIGGFEVQPTYPLAIDDHPTGVKNLKFLSPEFFDDLHFTAENAKKLGLRMNLTLGSGWPYGGPMFSANEAAGRLRIQNVQVAAGSTSVNLPALRNGEQFIAAFAIPRSAAQSDAGAIKEAIISGKSAQIPDGTAGPLQVLFFISSRTGMQVKRPALGAEGNVIDQLSSTVTDKFIKEVAEPEVNACGDNPLHSIFCDSLETNGEDWTDKFLDEFQKRRGYDLRPLLPALVSDIGPKTLDIRHDWGQTLTELFNDQFVAPLEKFAQQHNTQFRIQAYGSPSAGLFTYANAGLPEGEGYQWHDYRASRYASSATHLLGIPVASSETFTWLHSPVFRASPLDMKAEADLHFLQGINQIICHGWPYTAEGVAAPGWSFYAAADFNQNNPWWIVMPDISRYLQRTSFLMRQGRPANDVLLYLANSDAWAAFTPGHISLTDGVGAKLGPRIVGRILDAGYNLDFFDDQLLALRGKVDGGSISFGDVKYRVVVLAGVERIPPATLAKLEQFAKAGGIVIATRSLPSIAPGYLATDADQKTVHDTVQRMFVGDSAPAIFLPDEANFANAISKRLAPDVAISPAAPDIGVVHRHTDDAEIYFLANTGNVPHHFTATFRVSGMQPAIWNPMTAQGQPAVAGDQANSITLDLAPYESTVVIWSAANSPPVAETKPSSIPPIDVSGDWNVKFADAASPVAMSHLHSWTDDPATRNFSGVASYQKTINVPENFFAKDRKYWIDFGNGTPAPAAGGRGQNGYRTNLNAPVREAAVVYVNDQRAGSVWCPPYSLEISGLLKAGDNSIRIEVANLEVNALAASGFPNYDYQAVTRAFGNRFQPQNVNEIQPMPSGLLGPIAIVSK